MKQLKQLKQWHRKWFRKQVLVYSNTHYPGEFVKHIRSKGKYYVRVKFTNRQKYAGHIPLTDIPHDNVVYIRVFMWQWYRSLCEWAGWKVPEQIIWYNKHLKAQE